MVQVALALRDLRGVGGDGVPESHGEDKRNLSREAMAKKAAYYHKGKEVKEAEVGISQ